MIEWTQIYLFDLCLPQSHVHSLNLAFLADIESVEWNLIYRAVGESDIGTDLFESAHHFLGEHLLSIQKVHLRQHEQQQHPQHQKQINNINENR
jgi:hypothetical protein